MTSLKVHGTIRVRSIRTGTTKWREGSFEIVDKDNKVSLVVHYNAGGIPNTFQLNHNIKNVVVRTNREKLCYLMITLKDSSFLTVDKIPSKEANEIKLYLEAVQNRVHAAVKSTQGSGSFGGVLGSRITQKDSNRQFPYIENQTPSKKGLIENKDETPLRKVLSSPGRTAIKNSPGTEMSGNRVNISAASTASAPHRTGLLENRERRKRTSSNLEINEDYPKENDSSTNNKAVTDPARKFLYSSREKQLNLKQMEENRTSDLCGLYEAWSEEVWSVVGERERFGASWSCLESVGVSFSCNSLLLESVCGVMAPKKPAESGKRKRELILLEVKQDIIRKHEQGMRVVDLAREYGRSASTIETILKDKERIMGRETAKGVTILTKNRPAIMDEVEKLLLLWIREKERAGDTVTSAVVYAKARALHADLIAQQPGTSHEEFKASHGWFEKFKMRSGIRSVVRHGEAASSDLAAAEEFATEFLETVTAEGYLPEQVFNCDETGLFWKRMPRRTFITGGDQDAWPQADEGPPHPPLLCKRQG